MLTDLDAELFPDDCEVLETIPHNHHVYLIQKNGSSSLRVQATKSNWRLLRNREIFNCQSVDVYLRDPVQRYISGVNTFVQHLMRDHANLDSATCMTLASRYCFLNRHYLPQWHWMVNLARFLNPDCVINLRSISDLHQITPFKSRAGVNQLSDDAAARLLHGNTKLEFWFLLDRILLGHCGQSLTWSQILERYQTHPAQPMSTILHRTASVYNVLR